MSKVPESVRGALNRFSDRVMGSERFNLRAWVMDVVEAIYADPPTWQTPGFQPLDLGTNIISEPLVAGAYYECSDGVVRKAEATHNEHWVTLGDHLFCSDPTARDPVPKHFTILRRVWLTEKEPEATQVDPIEAVLKALDEAKCHTCIRTVNYKAAILHPDQIEGLKVLVKDCRTTTGTISACSRARARFTAAAKETK